MQWREFASTSRKEKQIKQQPSPYYPRKTIVNKSRLKQSHNHMVFRRKQITSWNDDDSPYVCALSSPSFLSFVYGVTSYASSHYMSKVDN